MSIPATLPDAWNGPARDDEVFVGRTPTGEITEAFWRDQAGTLRDIGRHVEGVEPTAEGYRVTGRKRHYGYPMAGINASDRWHADIAPDPESSDELLRGKVTKTI